MLLCAVSFHTTADYLEFIHTFMPTICNAEIFDQYQKSVPLMHLTSKASHIYIQTATNLSLTVK
jgi:hypothetical protein